MFILPYTINTTLHSCARAASLRASRHASPHEASHEAQSSIGSLRLPVTFAARAVSRPPRAEIRTRTNVARRRPALWGPGKHLGRHDFRPSRARCGVRAPAAAPPRSRHVPRACAGCRIIDRPVSGAGRGRENRAAPQSAATVSGPDRWAGAGGRRSPYGPARTSGRYGSGARCSIGASAKVIFGTGPLGFDDEMAIAVLVAHGNRG